MTLKAAGAFVYVERFNITKEIPSLSEVEASSVIAEEASLWTSPEKAQIRDALGVDGTKTAIASSRLLTDTRKVGQTLLVESWLNKIQSAYALNGASFTGPFNGNASILLKGYNFDTAEWTGSWTPAVVGPYNIGTLNSGGWTPGSDGWGHYDLIYITALGSSGSIVP